MKKKQDPVSKRDILPQYRVSNTVLIVILLLTPFLNKPVAREQASVRIVFEKQRVVIADVTPMTVQVTMKDGLAPIGLVTFLVLLFAYARKKEVNAIEEPDVADLPGMEMGDDEVLAAWLKVKGMLSEDDKN
ncbi:hypothetical protein [Chitinophaga sp. S165]|uniref:hypothetical protein n=1 Tax=Chitinophaga sp. S165 TaxID=2135462 RepID=UPI000D9287E3|nr:hypothetical protein [Chitinophaga sp. S165]PWV44517.1 hypothetical protein C7475_1201 [Chitinophaga sp. S165]